MTQAREELLRRIDSSNLSSWWTDFRWALWMVICRRYRRSLLFHQRLAFDDALRPKVPKRHPQHEPVVIAYPDAIYHTRPEDIQRAIDVTRALPKDRSGS